MLQHFVGWGKLVFLQKHAEDEGKKTGHNFGIKIYNLFCLGIWTWVGGGVRIFLLLTDQFVYDFSTHKRDSWLGSRSPSPPHVNSSSWLRDVQPLHIEPRSEDFWKNGHLDNPLYSQILEAIIILLKLLQKKANCYCTRAMKYHELLNKSERWNFTWKLHCGPEMRFYKSSTILPPKDAVCHKISGEPRVLIVHTNILWEKSWENLERVDITNSNLWTFLCETFSWLFIVLGLVTIEKLTRK